MPFAEPVPRGPRLVMNAIAAILCAAALVLYLQHRALSALEEQTRVILQKGAEQTAGSIAAEIRRTLEGPVFDTLTAVNHPQLREGRLDLVAEEYERGLAKYPHVERFLLWNAETDALARGEVVFYDGTPAARGAVTTHVGRRFARDRALGRAIFDLAKRHAGSQQIYLAGEGLGPGRRHDVFLRLFWTDASRVEFFAVLGFVIDAAAMRTDFVRELHQRRLASLLRVSGESPYELRVLDEANRHVFGPARPSPLSARVTVPMLFYPVNDIQSRLAAGIAPRSWIIEVSPPESPKLFGGAAPVFWLALVSVVLMLLALGFTVQANRRAAELARMQADFISHVSHQLKTPLSLLGAATETVAMERVRSPEKLAQYLEIIRSEVGRLSSLVQRILEFSRLQQPRTYEFESVDLGALVRETVDAFQRSLSGQQFTFRVEQAGASLQIAADPAALEQVLANLLDNAVKYSDVVKEVTVRVRRAGGDAVVEVVDRGVGIREEDQPRIFEKFYRGAAAPLHRQGFGLGLPIVQELVAAHRGRIEVESAPGRGSTFRIILPAHHAAASAASRRTAVTSEVAT